ncbi:MAG: DUF4430 domain-containing protein [Ruminococcaceae bacterium]|nr:DUF4430 domain-containing protein [Oscillospiraceae bacterium]
MKLYRVLALALAIVMIGCVVIACDQKEPEVTKKSIKVAFTIKDGPDKNSEILAQDAAYEYTYTGDKEPTVIDVLIDVCELEELTIEFEDETQERVKKIGSKSAGKGEYWTYALNGENDKDNPMYVQTVKEGDIIVVYLASLSD